MMSICRRCLLGVVLMRLAALSLCLAAARPVRAQPGPRTPNDTLHSPVVSANGSVTFQLYAPKANAVTIRSEGPAAFENKPMQKNEQGVWTYITTLPPDLYIYWYEVDSVAVADPRNNHPRVNMTTVRSLLHVPGPAIEFFADRDVPHGAVAEVWYQSASLGVARRMHVYTPPGYESNTTRYPVFYLLHGAGDNDESWPAVGRANFILDNLIAAGKAKPMIVVMPAGHTPRPGGLFGPPGSRDPFIDDFLKDIMPYVEQHYRTLPGRTNRAIAGLSMGGDHTLRIGLLNLDRFAYLGVFSSGILGSFNMGPAAADSAVAVFARQNAAVLEDPKINAKIKVLWLSTGTQDFIMPFTKATLALFDAHHVKYTFTPSDGGHTWPNWRAYLSTFVPLLFR